MGSMVGRERGRLVGGVDSFEFGEYDEILIELGAVVEKREREGETRQSTRRRGESESCACAWEHVQR